MPRRPSSAGSREGRETVATSLGTEVEGPWEMSEVGGITAPSLRGMVQVVNDV